MTTARMLWILWCLGWAAFWLLFIFPFGIPFGIGSLIAIALPVGKQQMAYEQQNGMLVPVKLPKAALPRGSDRQFTGWRVAALIAIVVAAAIGVSLNG